MINYVVDVGFVNAEGKDDETELDVVDFVELVNLILELREEMGIKEINYIEIVDDYNC